MTPGRPLSLARAATYFSFFLLGLGFAVWVSRIPAVKDGLHLSDGALGLALLALPAGSVLAMPACGWLVDRFGAATTTRLGGMLMGVTLVAPGLAGDLAWLVVALLAFGAAAALLDVGMNAYGVSVERAYGRPLMSSFHASYSIAGLVGAVIGGQFARAGVGVLDMLIVTAVPFVVAAWACGRLLVPAEPPPSPDAPSPDTPSPDTTGSDAPPSDAPPPVTSAAAVPSAGPEETAPAEPDEAPARTRRGVAITIAVLGLLGVCATLGEGAAADWGAVYLHDELGTTEAFAPAAYAAFSVAMAVGRLLGDRLALLLGPVWLVRASGLVAAAGLGGALLTDDRFGAVVGFGVMGAGLSCIVPQLFSAAGRADPARAGRVISLVAGLSYVGIVGGPAVIGVVAEFHGLRLALAVPVVLALLVAVAAGMLAPSRRDRP